MPNFRNSLFNISFPDKERTLSRMDKDEVKSFLDCAARVTYKGEFVLIVGGADTVESDTSEVLDEPVSYEDAVQALVDTGVPKKEAIRQVAKRFNVSRRDVYNIVER